MGTCNPGRGPYNGLNKANRYHVLLRAPALAFSIGGYRSSIDTVAVCLQDDKSGAKRELAFPIH
jgi:hypothetical protein